MGKKGGRPRHNGERYPSGKLKQHETVFGVSPAEWARIRTDGVKVANNPKLGSEIGRLSFHRQITDAQAAAAFRIGDIFRLWHRYKRLRTSPKSPNYEQGFGGSADLAEERMNPDQLLLLEDKIKATHEAWEALDGERGLLRQYPAQLRAVVIDLCVLDRAILPTQLPEVKLVLDRLAKQFADGRRVRAKLPVPQALKPAPALDRAQRTKDGNIHALKQVVRKIRPDLDEDGVVLCIDTFLALRDREKFRNGKGAR